MPTQKVLFISEIKNVLAEKIRSQDIIEKLTDQLIKGARDSLEIDKSFDDWIERFKYQFIWLDKDDYLRALIRALWLAPKFAATDFGSPRQRDLGQIWTDTARGFLGEIALSKFFLTKFSLETKLDIRRGNLKDFLPSDIVQIRKQGSDWRNPRLKISIKTTKFNGRWLDLPGAQYKHSDVFVLVKIGILRQHFLAFLKAVSFIKDKLFTKAKELGELDNNNANELWNDIPEFEPIPTYIAGFLNMREINFPIHCIKAKPKGKNKIIITHGVGLFTQNNILELSEIKFLISSGQLSIEIEPIGPLKGQHFYAHSGSLLYGEENWKKLIEML